MTQGSFFKWQYLNQELYVHFKLLRVLIQYVPAETCRPTHSIQLAKAASPGGWTSHLQQQRVAVSRDLRGHEASCRGTAGGADASWQPRSPPARCPPAAHHTPPQLEENLQSLARSCHRDLSWHRRGGGVLCFGLGSCAAPRRGEQSASPQSAPTSSSIALNG